MDGTLGECPLYKSNDNCMRKQPTRFRDSQTDVNDRQHVRQSKFLVTKYATKTLHQFVRNQLKS